MIRLLLGELSSFFVLMGIIYLTGVQLDTRQPLMILIAMLLGGLLGYTIHADEANTSRLK